MIKLLVLTAFMTLQAQANPYYDESAVPKDVRMFSEVEGPEGEPVEADGLPSLRVEIGWQENGETYSLTRMVRENSGTTALVRRALKADPLGSYRAILRDLKSRRAIAHDSIGTGKEYRKLVRALTFRFPMISKSVMLEVYAENPLTGATEMVLEKKISPERAETAEPIDDANFEVRLLKKADQEPSLRVNIYADGYTADRKMAFWTAAKKAVDGLLNTQFPGVGRFEFRAVFLTSAQKIGSAKDLGMPVPDYGTALGLYFPYWDNFGRWYHVVYPTRENRFRSGLATVGYDYPIVLLDDGAYWGVGNYKEKTAIPANSGSFTYLLLHELGHFFGLNEEYEGGGRTELEFAPQMAEPWSQNITFLRSTEHTKLKWSEHVLKSTPLPTSASVWNPAKPLFGAYRGGYADSAVQGSHSHKPGYACTMEANTKFCPVCTAAIKKVVERDLGN